MSDGLEGTKRLAEKAIAARLRAFEAQTPASTKRADDALAAFHKAITPQKLLRLINVLRMVESDLLQLRIIHEVYDNALEEVECLINESRGVVGYHLNGEEASWEYLFDVTLPTVKKIMDGPE